jgi:hypothetical protein
MRIVNRTGRAALTEREEDAQRRLDFAAFAQQCFRELNPLVPLAMNWHVEIIAAKLAAVYRGEIRRLIVNVPPRYLKSLLASVRFRRGASGVSRVRKSFASAMPRTSPTSSRAIAAAS